MLKYTSYSTCRIVHVTRYLIKEREPTKGRDYVGGRNLCIRKDIIVKAQRTHRNHLFWYIVDIVIAIQL